ncbi:MAG: aspartyl protease family protein, partial [Halieaceae bacterium]|nr:aspartyl protease family protein [Halieaceae bacterium]
MYHNRPRAGALPFTSLVPAGVLGAALLLCLGGCQLIEMARFSYANARSTHQWANGQASTTVPFRLVDDHIILPVRVNGSEPMDFVLDSGAGAVVIIDSRASRDLQLDMGGELSVSGVGTGPDPVARIVGDTGFSLGDLRLQGLSVIYLPLDAIPFFDDLDDVYFDGVIGAPFFSRFVVEIDFDRQLITFTEPSAAAGHLAQLGDNWREEPLQIDSGLPYIMARVDPGEGEPVEVKLLVDTGFRAALSLTPATHEGLDEPREYFQSVGQGLSGDVFTRVAMSDSLTLSGYQLPGLPVRYAMAGGESESGSHGLLGSAVLQKFNLAFDYPNERLYLTPNRNFDTPVPVDRSGLLIRPHAAGGMVKRIAPGSSAEASSLQSGDIITSFDDRPVNK